MGIAAGPNISRDGLILWYDVGNSKSFRGEVTTNLVNTVWSNWSTDGSGFGPTGTKTVITPTHIRITDNNTNLRHYIFIFGISANTTYTFSVKFKAITGVPTLRFQIQYYTDGTFLSSAFPTTSQIGIVDTRDWQTAIYTITTPSNTNKILWFMQDGDDYVGYTHIFELKEPQLEARNYASPFVDGTRGTTVAAGGGLIDLSGRINNGEVLNGATSSTSFGGYLVFDGTNDYVRFPMTATTTISVSCWVRSSSWSTQTHPMIVAKGINVEWILWKSDDAGNDEKFGWRSSSGSSIYSTTTAQNNIWYHLLATVGSAGMRLYINGVLEASNGNTAVPSGSIDVCIGSGLSGGNPSNYLLGDVAALQIWSKQLSTTEVTQVYQTIRTRFISRSSIVASGLILHLDAGNPNSYGRSGSTWNDISGYGSNGTLTNGPTFRAENGGGFLFDGINDFVSLGDTPFRFNNSSFSIEVVFYYNGNNVVYPLVAKRNSGNPYDQYALAIYDGQPYVGGAGNKLTYFTRPDSGNGSFDRVVTYTLPSAGIYHCIVTSSSTSLVLYVNGVTQSTYNSDIGASTFNIANRNLRIGDMDISSFYSGRIFLVRIYSKTLSATEVLQNYNATKSRFGL